jgi:hypothetical protein
VARIKQPYVIFAPHIDDELIGCFRLLCNYSVEKVFFFFDLDSGRKLDAESCGRSFKFKPVFITAWKDDPRLEVGRNKIILAPHIRDGHPHHKRVNQLAKSFTKNSIQYYSIDMNTPGRETLDHVARRSKLLHLDEFYRDQSQLWERDSKYYMFESLEESDLIRQVEVSTRFEGTHKYPKAPAGVEFLAHEHRHIFHVNVRLDVFHNDREVEFILFKREIETFIRNNMKQLNHRSCEMIGETILEYVTGRYLGRSCRVSVFEDGESGAHIEFRYN